MKLTSFYGENNKNNLFEGVRTIVKVKLCFLKYEEAEFFYKGAGSIKS